MSSLPPLAALPRVAVTAACKCASRLVAGAAHPLHQGPGMKQLMMFVFTAALATACSKDKTPSCEDVFAHTKSLVPAEMQDVLEKSRAQAIEKCGTLSAEAKQCAMKATSMAELQKCPRD